MCYVSGSGWWSCSTVVYSCRFFCFFEALLPIALLCMMILQKVFCNSKFVVLEANLFLSCDTEWKSVMRCDVMWGVYCLLQMVEEKITCYEAEESSACHHHQYFFLDPYAASLLCFSGNRLGQSWIVVLRHKGSHNAISCFCAQTRDSFHNRLLHHCRELIVGAIYCWYCRWNIIALGFCLSLFSCECELSTCVYKNSGNKTMYVLASKMAILSWNSCPVCRNTVKFKV